MKQGGHKVSCDITETVFRKLEGLSLINGSVFRQDLDPMDIKQLNALFGNPEINTFHAI